MVIALDFDGTIVEHKYPAIGEEIPFATETIRMLIAERHKVILWSVREGKLLDEAVNWSYFISKTIHKKSLVCLCKSKLPWKSRIVD